MFQSLFIEELQRTHNLGFQLRKVLKGDEDSSGMESDDEDEGNDDTDDDDDDGDNGNDNDSNSNNRDNNGNNYNNNDNKHTGDDICKWLIYELFDIMIHLRIVIDVDETSPSDEEAAAVAALRASPSSNSHEVC